jgi:excisionase family DNA binding protein
MENLIVVQMSIQQLRGIITEAVKAEFQNSQKLTTDVKEFLTVSQAAKKLNLSKVTIYEYLKKGVFKKSKIGKRTLISVESINAAIMDVELPYNNL